MKNKAAVLLLIGLFLGWLVSCGESTPETSSSTPTTASDSTAAPTSRPKDSEMTLLMRNLYDSVRVFRQSAKTGENRQNIAALVKQVHSANLSDPSQRGVIFNSFARGLEVWADSLEAQDHPTAAVYNELVASCLTCHESFCPGPMGRIRKLRWKDPTDPSAWDRIKSGKLK